MKNDIGRRSIGLVDGVVEIGAAIDAIVEELRLVVALVFHSFKPPLSLHPIEHQGKRIYREGGWGVY